MKKKYSLTILVLIILALFASVNILEGKEDILFIGAKWGVEEVDHIATPGSIDVITVYIAPTLANGLKDVVAELYLPEPLTGLDGGKVVKTSSLVFIPKGQILPLMFKVIIPLNVVEGNYTFKLKVKYTILAPLAEERKWEIEFNLPILGRTVVYAKLLTNTLEKGKIQGVNFNITYIGNEPAEINVDFRSETLSILDYEPKKPILADKPYSFEAKAKVYCPPDIKIDALPITITITYRTLQSANTYSKTYMIPISRKAEVEFTEIQPIVSDNTVTIRGQLVNVGDYDAKYLTVYATSPDKDLAIENPITYIGTLTAGEGSNFLIYASTTKPGKYSISLSAKYYGPDMKWHEISEEINVEVTGIAKKEEISVPLRYEEVLPVIIALSVATLIVGIIIGRYTRWKSV
ncbi:MAG: hypothetical protein DRO23_00260 [Thermoprotei archaeon]|nr:MAG: hypothetical protein DRO23_00260 [Thermoprotei archaeon]